MEIYCKVGDDLNIVSIGYNTIHGENYSVDRKNGTESYYLVLIKRPCIFVIDGNEIFADIGSIVIYDKNSPQKFYSEEDIFIYDWICFDIEGDTEFWNSLEVPLNTIIKYTDITFLSEIIRNLGNEFYSIGINRKKMVDSLLKAILIKISETRALRVSIKQSADPHYNSLIELREKIYQNPQIKWNVEIMASEVNMSRSYFQHIYRETFGVSCISDVINCKIDRAKELLSTTSCTVSQVAAMCGYDSDEHFMRQFKKNVGVTPTVYRKNI